MVGVTRTRGRIRTCVGIIKCKVQSGKWKVSSKYFELTLKFGLSTLNLCHPLSVRKWKPSSLPRDSPWLILWRAASDLFWLTRSRLLLFVGFLRTALLLLCDTVLLAHLKASLDIQVQGGSRCSAVR